MALAVAACAPGDSARPAAVYHLNTTYRDQFVSPDPSPAGFMECHGFGCAETSRAELDDGDWRRIAALFDPPASDPAAERRQIAQAVALTQLLVGVQTGTAAHQWTHDHMMIRPNFGDPTQLDCIDEAVNTWTYLTLMEKGGLFRFHRVAQLSYAGSMLDLNQRNTAVLAENGGGYFAVDPSLVDVGVPPPILPLATWMGAWPPRLQAGDAVVQSRR